MKKLNIFLVGGALRDKLLGLNIKERDWVVVGSNFKIMFHLNFKLVGKDFPVFLNPINKEEYALARKIFVFDNFNKKNYFDFCSFVTLVNDLLHRDLTVNSLVLSESGCLIDMFRGLFYLRNRFLYCVSFAFSCDKLRVFRVVRFFVKYYYYGFIILPCVFILIQNIVFSGIFLNFTIERVLKEIFIVLSYKFSFLFFDILYRSSILNVFFYELHVLFLFSSLFNFNLYLDFSLNVSSLLYFLFDYTNNVLLKFSVLFLKLFCKCYYFNKSFRYKRINNLLLNYYKKKFHLSKKYCKFLCFLSIFFSFYNKFIFIKDCFIYFFLKKVNSYKNKIQFINILLICFLDGKYNCIVNNFYFKYFILDILNEMIKYRFLNTKFFDDNINDTNYYKKIICKYKNIYNNLYYFL